MKKLRKMLLLFCVLSLQTCSYYPTIPKSIKNSFTYCYDGKYTGLDTLINIEGYYEKMVVHKDHLFLKDTSYHYFMFYDNGLFVYSIRDIYYDDKKREWIKKNDVSSFLNDFSENSEALGANYFYGNYWGSYILCGDTIKIQQFYRGGSLNDGWFAREVWYKIIDKNIILYINSFNIPTTLYSRPVNRTHLALFIPLSSKPKSDHSWLLKEKWFWCNEEDWKDYMEVFKKDNRNNRKQ